MSTGLGKGFEKRFKTLVENEGCDCIRFHDTLYVYKEVDNPCDFIISKDSNSPSILIECKATSQSSFNLKHFRQLDRLLKLSRFRSFLVISYSSKEVVIAIEVQEIELLKKNKVKSINPDKMGKYPYVHPVKLSTVFGNTHPKTMEVKKLWERI